MISISLCLFAIALSFYAGRRSMVTGVVAVMGFGYFYGIIRANLAEPFAHFIFDAAALGFYLSQLWRPLSPALRLRERKLRAWLLFLVSWPLILILVPVQDPLVELVGLRGHIFLLPFLLIGARLKSEEVNQIALWLAILNLAVFPFAVAEYFLGVGRFFPLREGVTSIIYASASLDDYSALRIPATFTSAAAYGGVMVMTIPFLVGALVQSRLRAWHRPLLAASLGCSLVGVFMSASRTPVIILVVLLLVATFSGRLPFFVKMGWVVILIGLGWLVSSDQRLQRFMSLKDTDYVAERLQGSVNSNFGSLAVAYPMGNGLGGGGTSLPYFLQNRLKNQVGMESEYARIMLEQGIPGLCLWIAFLFWVFSRRVNPRPSGWDLGRRLAWCVCACYFATGLIGIGLLTAIPHTCLLLMCVGWIGVPPSESCEKPIPVSSGHNIARQMQAQQSYSR